MFTGCMDKSACNFLAIARTDNGTCTYPKEDHDCEGNCLIDVDCFGVCGGDAVVDRCGKCGGDNSTCEGCMDTTACNYNPTATHGDNKTLCKYALPQHNCAGQCTVELDCLGKCGGQATVDECGVCDGDGSSCREVRRLKSEADARSAVLAEQKAMMEKQNEQIAMLQKTLATLTAALGTGADAANNPALLQLQATIAALSGNTAAEPSEEDTAKEEEEEEKEEIKEVEEKKEVPCARDCKGKSCDEWVREVQVSCAVLQQHYNCSCKGCASCRGAGAGTHWGLIDPEGRTVVGGSETLPATSENLPRGWKASVDVSSNRTYYFHTDGRTQWELPTDEDKTKKKKLVVVEEDDGLDGAPPPMFFSEYAIPNRKSRMLEIVNAHTSSVPMRGFEVRVSKSTPDRPQPLNWTEPGCCSRFKIPSYIILDAGQVLVVTSYNIPLPGISMHHNAQLRKRKPHRCAEYEVPESSLEPRHPCDKLVVTVNDEEMSFDGNDAVGLFYRGLLIDTIGSPLVDLPDLPDDKSAWPVAGDLWGTRHALRRKEYVVAGNTDWVGPNIHFLRI